MSETHPIPSVSSNGHTDIIARLESGERSNTLDVLIEVALFEPDGTHFDAVSNSAGTKVTYANRDGSFQTHWAPDWSLRPDKAIALLRALSGCEGHGTSQSQTVEAVPGMDPNLPQTLTGEGR